MINTFIITLIINMTPQEIKYYKKNTTILSIVLKFIEFINTEINEDKIKNQ